MPKWQVPTTDSETTSSKTARIRKKVPKQQIPETGSVTATAKTAENKKKCQNREWPKKMAAQNRCQNNEYRKEVLKKGAGMASAETAGAGKRCRNGECHPSQNHGSQSLVSEASSGKRLTGPTSVTHKRANSYQNKLQTKTKMSSMEII
jgi:hypothetical protein